MVWLPSKYIILMCGRVHEGLCPSSITVEQLQYYVNRVTKIEERIVHFYGTMTRKLRKIIEYQGDKSKVARHRVRTRAGKASARKEGAKAEVYFTPLTRLASDYHTGLTRVIHSRHRSRFSPHRLPRSVLSFSHYLESPHDYRGRYESFIKNSRVSVIGHRISKNLTATHWIKTSK